MATTVTFGMSWEVYARQTIVLPDDIDPSDKEIVREYIQGAWPFVPIPKEGGEYIEGSDEFDEYSELVFQETPDEEEKNT